MAKIKFGAMMVDARGKLGGHVFSKNRGGAYLRTKVTPSNPQTEAQVEQRSLLASASQAWKALTEAQRQAWNGAVSGYATTNIFGDIVNPSGATLHTRVNINVGLAGGSALLIPPTPIGVAAVGGFSVTADVSDEEVELGWTSGAVPAGCVRIVEATPLLSAGIYNANNKFRQIASLASATATGVNVHTQYTAKFGALVAGKKLFVRVKDIVIATGEVSQVVMSSAIVIA